MCFQVGFIHLRNELRIFCSSPVTLNFFLALQRLSVSASGCLQMRTGFIQQRTVRNEGLSGEFVSDCL